MGSDLIASRIHNPGVVRDMLRLMGDVVAEDGIDIDSAHLDTEGVCWLMIYFNGEQVALYKLIPVNAVSLEVHVNVTPEHRKSLRYETCKAMYRWVLGHTQYLKLIAWVPSLHRHIKRFAVEMGMTVEGVSTDSYRKHGKLHNQWLLGITRQQMEAYA